MPPGPAGPPAAQADLPEGPIEPNSTGSKGSLACPRDGVVPKLVSTHLSAPSAQSTEQTGGTAAAVKTPGSAEEDALRSQGEDGALPLSHAGGALPLPRNSPEQGGQVYADTTPSAQCEDGNTCSEAPQGSRTGPSLQHPTAPAEARPGGSL